MSDRKKIDPPAWPRKFFEWYCDAETAEDLTGDMEELFHQNIKKMSVAKAQWKYVLQTVVLIFSYAVRNRKRRYSDRFGASRYHSVDMYLSYSKIAVRSLAKQKAFSVINIICLSVGMSVGLLALAAFIDVLEVDKEQANADRIHRITTTVDDGNEKITYASSSAVLAEELRSVSAIEDIVQLRRQIDPEVVQSPNTAVPLNGYYATSNFLKVFTFPLIEGNAASALNKPFSVIITESAAKKLFSEGHALGKLLEVKDLGIFEITGIVKDYPRSHLDFEVIASYNTLPSLEQQDRIPASLQDWGPVTSHYTYALFDDGDQSGIQSSLNRVVAAAFSRDKKISVSYGIQKLGEIPMSDLNREIGLSWGYIPLVIFFSLAMLVLLPACFNYTNITIARALKRAKEIGLRKVSGGQSRHIFMQMVMETVIISVISLTGAMLIFGLIRDGFMDMMVNGHRSFDLRITPVTFFIFLLFAVFTGFLAGVFPALYFSKLNPIETLRNSTHNGSLSKISIRKELIVAQFALSMIFILGVAIIAKQYSYALNYDMGFQKENILDIQLKNADAKLLKTALEKMKEVTSVSMSSSIPGNWNASAKGAHGRRGSRKHKQKNWSAGIDKSYVFSH